MSSFKYQDPSIIIIQNIVAVSCFDILETIHDCDLVQAYLNFKTDLSPPLPSTPLDSKDFYAYILQWTKIDGATYGLRILLIQQVTVDFNEEA